MIAGKVSLSVPFDVEKGAEAYPTLETSTTKVTFPPIRYKFMVTKNSTGERWLLRPGDPLPTEHCGGFYVELYRAKMYDYLCLFSKKVRSPEPRYFFVLPDPVELSVPPDLTLNIARSFRPKHGGGFAEHHELRPYRPGDRLNLVHWKLSAKTDTLMVREPMIPDGSRLLLTLELNGTPALLDEKLGQLLWLGTWLTDQQVAFEVVALTGNGTGSWHIQEKWEFDECLKDLLWLPQAPEDAVFDGDYAASLHYHIGGEQNDG